MKEDKNFRTQWRYFFNFFLTFNTVRKLRVGLTIFTLYTLILAILNFHFLEGSTYKITSIIHSILGLALGLLLVFRTNTAYERWWEGRKLLGSLTNDSRNLTIKIQAYFKDTATKKYMGRMVAAYCFSLKNHLRDDRQIDYDFLLSTEEIAMLTPKKHQPNAIATWLYEFINMHYQKREISDIQFLTINEHLRAFTDIIGGCERIKKTPMPFAYSIHLSQFLNLYFVTLPFVLITDLGYWAILFIGLIYYALAGLRTIGEEIEDPFGKDENDLPVEAICQNIFTNIHEILHIEKPSETSPKETTAIIES